MSRRRHHKTERLSVEAQRIVEEGLRKSVAYETIAEWVCATTGEEISPSAIGRYYSAKFRPREDGRIAADRIADKIASQLAGMSDDGLRRAMKLTASERLFDMMEAFAANKPDAVAKFIAALDANAVMHDSNAVRREELALRTKKLEAELQAAKEKIEAIRLLAEAQKGKGTKGARTPEAVRQALEQIYGITISNSPAAGGVPPHAPAAGDAVSMPQSGPAQAIRGDGAASRRMAPGSAEMGAAGSRAVGQGSTAASSRVGNDERPDARRSSSDGRRP